MADDDTKSDRWETVSEIARRLGLEPREVERAAIQTGMSRSRTHARDSAVGREYSGPAVLLIERDIRAQADYARRLPRPAAGQGDGRNPHPGCG